jgi:transposase
MPSKRICETFRDLLGVKVSEGFIYKAYERCYVNLNGYEQSVKAMLQCAEVAHFDESGTRVKKELHWLHVAATQELTHYAIHEKRGKEAMEAIGILPEFKGRAIHDHWKAYFSYECDHGLCNAHHLRELTYQHEQYDQKWCEQMRSLLLRCNQEVHAAKDQQQQSLSEEKRTELETEYDAILTAGLMQIPAIAPSEGKRGKKKQHPARNLMDRLSGFKEETLAFMNDFRIPFTNNQGEQDIRMIKVKQKISGCFRSKGGAKVFCRIRGYVSTARKQSQQVFEALVWAVKGSPIVPNTS